VQYLQILPEFSVPGLIAQMSSLQPKMLDSITIGKMHELKMASNKILFMIETAVIKKQEGVQYNAAPAKKSMFKNSVNYSFQKSQMKKERTNSRQVDESKKSTNS
jgi:hypothetical protein